MMEVTSPAVGKKASRLLRKRHLSDADLPDVHSVAACALTQRAVAVKTRPALAAFLRAGTIISDPRIPDVLRRKLAVEFEKMIAPISPAKP
jgi:hypothetical protein